MPKDINEKPYSRKVLMGIVLSGAFVALLAETFLNNGLTTIMDSLRVSQATAQWLSTAYQLVMGLMIPLSAWVFNNFKSKDSYKGMLGFVYLLYRTELCNSAVWSNRSSHCSWSVNAVHSEHRSSPVPT